MLQKYSYKWGLGILKLVFASSAECRQVTTSEVRDDLNLDRCRVQMFFHGAGAFCTEPTFS